MSHVERPDARRSWLFSVIFALGIGVVYVIDISLPSGHVGAYSYTVLVILAVLTYREWLIAAISIAGAAGTALAFMFKPALTSTLSTNMIIFNRASAAILVLAAGIAGIIIVRQGKRVRQFARELTRSRDELVKQYQMVQVGSEMGRIGGWSVDLTDGGLMQWSAEIAAIHGFDSDESLTWDEVVESSLPADQDRVRAAFERCAIDGTPLSEEYRVQGPDGAMVWILCVGEAVRDDTGRIVGLHGAKQDITSWRTAEESAHSQRHRFEQMTEALPFIMWIATSDGAIEFINQVAKNYSGLSDDELLGMGWRQMIHPDDTDSARRVWETAVESGTPHEDEYRLRNANGDYLWHRVQGFPEKDDNGAAVRWWGSAIDIHDAVELRRQAQILAAERETILQSMGDAVFALDHEWRFTYLNANAEELLSRRSDELVGTVLWEEFPEAKGTRFEEVYRRVAQKRSREQFVEYYPPLEKWSDVSVSASDDGLIVFFRDVTEIRSLTEQLQQAQRLESVGRLTGGIAHDFNNLLTVVIGCAEALTLDNKDLSGEARDMVEMISDAAERGADLTHRLLAFARRQPLDPRAVDTSRSLRELLPLIERTLGDRVAIEANLPSDLPLSLVDPKQLENAILNLSINARDAMREGGTLTIETAFASLDEAYATAHGEVYAGDYVVVSVSDSGTGIEAAHLPKLFDPFFTTKAVGEGSGMGLPMVWGFVKQTGGHVSVYSEVGHGSTFRLYLPLAEREATVSEKIRVRSDADLSGEGHVLLAEDDLLVQQFAAQQLRALGYQVT
ncbi:MAG: PAS domain S-box protein, partial [Demequina sp.]